MSCNVVNSGGLGQYIYGFPCPYDSVMDPGPALAPLLQATGLSGCNGGCGCGGGCGMGALTMDGTGLFGSGLFSSAFDISTWGIGEYMALAFGAYMLYSVVGTTKAEVRRASKGYRRMRTRIARPAAA